MSERNFLKEILTHRRVQMEKDQTICHPQVLRGKATRVRSGRPQHRLRKSLQQNKGINIIGEFKRASPALGTIRSGANPVQVAAVYDAAGVCAISVVTEPDFFHGSLEDLRKVRAVTELPILRKDFIIDEYQIDQAAEAGADAILLIVAALTSTDFVRLREFAEDELGLDALVEVHTAEEMKRATDGGARLVGVNNRDLRTFTTSIDTSVELADLAPPETILVSESGISSRAQIDRLSTCGYRGFLIGESLMRAPDPAALICHLRGTTMGESRHA